MARRRTTYFPVWLALPSAVDCRGALQLPRWQAWHFAPLPPPSTPAFLEVYVSLSCAIRSLLRTYTYQRAPEPLELSYVLHLKTACGCVFGRYVESSSPVQTTESHCSTKVCITSRRFMDVLAIQQTRNFPSSIPPASAPSPRRISHARGPSALPWPPTLMSGLANAEPSWRHYSDFSPPQLSVPYTPLYIQSCLPQLLKFRFSFPLPHFPQQQLNCQTRYTNRLFCFFL